MTEVASSRSHATKRAREEQQAAAVQQRTQQLQCTDTSIDRLKQGLQAARGKTTEHERFISHLAGFYDEVDKLAKGKSLFPATDMIVDGINAIVRDAKTLIDGDIYIDRLKEFVPAGDNPVYPDILMAARTVQQATARFKETLDTRRRKLAKAIQEAETIKCALEIFVEDQGHVASKDEMDIENPTANWFDGDELFDFQRLDTLELSDYLMAALMVVVDGEE